MKVNILSDKKMELLGFHFNKYNERWVLIKPLISSIDFYFTIESNNFQKIIDAGIDFMPVLELDNGKLLQFNEAINYVNNL